MKEETVKAIAAELTKAYLMAHRSVPESSIEIVAASIADAVPAITAQNAHDVFRRAMQTDAIPTVPTLVTAAKNHIAESYSEAGGTPSIEYRDPCEAWLPKSDVIKRINLNTAIANYCIACGGNSYANLCSARVRGKEAYEARNKGHVAEPVHQVLAQVPDSQRIPVKRKAQPRTNTAFGRGFPQDVRRRKREVRMKKLRSWLLKMTDYDYALAEVIEMAIEAAVIVAFIFLPMIIITEM